MRAEPSATAAVPLPLEFQCIVDAASTVDVGSGARTGLASTIDGVALSSAGMRVLLKDQATPSENGVWAIRSGAWKKLGQFDVVYMRKGTLSAVRCYMRTSANVYEKM